MYPRMKKFTLLVFLAATLVFSAKGLMNPQADLRNSDVVSVQKPLRTLKNEAFKPGEKLTFRLHYGLISAGEGTLEVLPEKQTFVGRVCYHVVGTGETVGAFDWFFKVRDTYESIIDTPVPRTRGFL